MVSRFLDRCLQVLNISLLLFRVAPSDLYKIYNFSFRHIPHFFVVGLKADDLSLSFQLTSKSIPLSFRFQICALKPDFVLFFSFLMSVLCSYNRFLKVLPVTPVYVSTLPLGTCVTAASYTTQSVRHFPPTGQFWGPPWQLHLGPSTLFVYIC